MKYYYEHNGSLVEASIRETVKAFKASNPHLTLVREDKLTERHVAMLAEAEKQKQRSLRRKEYPPIGDQLDAIMKWLFTETEFTVPPELKSLAAKCMSVKSKYPLGD